MARLLYDRDEGKQRIVDLFAVIDWLMKLPDEINRRHWREIESLEKDKNMPHITSVERFCVEKGIQLGIAQGMEQGIEQGEIIIPTKQLAKRFGPLPRLIKERWASATTAQLEIWAERILDPETPGAVFDRR